VYDTDVACGPILLSFTSARCNTASNKPQRLRAGVRALTQMGVHVLAIGSEPLESIGPTMAKSKLSSGLSVSILSDPSLKDVQAYRPSTNSKTIPLHARICSKLRTAKSVWQADIGFDRSRTWNSCWWSGSGCGGSNARWKSRTAFLGRPCVIQKRTGQGRPSYSTLQPLDQRPVRNNVQAL